MNKNFIIVDKVNNIQRTATKIVKFTLDNKDYLIYSVDENEENRQIFVSRLIMNMEGKYFIEAIAAEEKAKLSDIVYNIIILTPTNFKKGEVASTLLNNLTEKFKITLSNDDSELGMQEYYNVCSIAITSKELVSLAITFFEENLIQKTSNSEEEFKVPTWNIPSNEVIENKSEEIKAEVPNTSIENSQTNNNVQQVTPIPNASENIIPEINVIPAATIEPTVIPITENNVTPVQQPVQQTENVLENAQNPQLAVVSDPSLANVTGVNVQPNVMKLNNKGKANIKYIIIGTACILLAIAVVIVAYILIQQKTTGV